jgi:hypothetical protein
MEWSSLGTASKMVATTLLLHLNKELCPAALKVKRVFGQAQHPGGYLPALLPDFAPCDIFLFHRLIIMLKGKNFKMKITPKAKRFQNTAERQLNMTWQLWPILKEVYITHGMEMEGLMESFHAGWIILL